MTSLSKFQIDISDQTKIILWIDRDAMNGIGLDRNDFESQAKSEIYNFVASHVLYSTYHTKGADGASTVSNHVPYITWMTTAEPILFQFGPEASIHLRMSTELWQTLALN